MPSRAPAGSSRGPAHGSPSKAATASGGSGGQCDGSAGSGARSRKEPSVVSCGPRTRRTAPLPAVICSHRAWRLGGRSHGARRLAAGSPLAPRARRSPSSGPLSMRTVIVARPGSRQRDYPRGYPRSAARRSAVWTTGDASAAAAGVVRRRPAGAIRQADRRLPGLGGDPGRPPPARMAARMARSSRPPPRDRRPPRPPPPPPDAAPRWRPACRPRRPSRCQARRRSRPPRPSPGRAPADRKARPVPDALVAVEGGEGGRRVRDRPSRCPPVVAHDDQGTALRRGRRPPRGRRAERTCRRCRQVGDDLLEAAPVRPDGPQGVGRSATRGSRARPRWARAAPSPARSLREREVLDLEAKAPGLHATQLEQVPDERPHPLHDAPAAVDELRRISGSSTVSPARGPGSPQAASAFGARGRPSRRIARAPAPAPAAACAPTPPRPARSPRPAPPRGDAGSPRGAGRRLPRHRKPRPARSRPPGWRPRCRAGGAGP